MNATLVQTATIFYQTHVTTYPYACIHVVIVCVRACVHLYGYLCMYVHVRVCGYGCVCTCTCVLQAIHKWVKKKYLIRKKNFKQGIGIAEKANK